MRRKALIILLAFCMMFSLAACGGRDEETGGDTLGDNPIKIAHIGPLTGDGEPWGMAEINALKMMVKEINASGGILDGRKIELYSYDNRSDNVETTNAARKAINDDGVSAIIGTNASSNSIALAGICEDLKVPHIATAATNPRVTVKDDGSVRPYSFRVTITDTQQGEVAANFALNDLNAKTAAILYEIGSDYSLGLKEAFEETFSSSGGEIVAVEAYKTGDVDFRSQFSKIKEKNPDVIFLPALYKEIALATNQARTLGVESTFIGGDSWLNTDLFTLAPDAIEGSYYVNPINVDDPLLTDFKAKYEAEYNQPAGAEGGNCFLAHDALMMLIDAIERAGSDDPEAIRDALEEIENLEGITGVITVDKETHNPTKPVSVFRISINPNKFEFIKKVAP